jgi:hypothetical protein
MSDFNIEHFSPSCEEVEQTEKAKEDDILNPRPQAKKKLRQEEDETTISVICEDGEEKKNAANGKLFNSAGVTGLTIAIVGNTGPLEKKRPNDNGLYLAEMDAVFLRHPEIETLRHELKHARFAGLSRAAQAKIITLFINLKDEEYFKKFLSHVINTKTSLDLDQDRTLELVSNDSLGYKTDQRGIFEHTSWDYDLVFVDGKLKTKKQEERKRVEYPIARVVDEIISYMSNGDEVSKVFYNNLPQEVISYLTKLGLIGREEDEDLIASLC